MTWDQTPRGIDRNYLRTCKEHTTEQRLNWLAAALDFARMVERKQPRKEPPTKQRQ